MRAECDGLWRVIHIISDDMCSLVDFAEPPFLGNRIGNKILFLFLKRDDIGRLHMFTDYCQGSNCNWLFQTDSIHRLLLIL